MSNPFSTIETARLLWPEGLPFSETFNDTYFSTENGLAEKRHVFINSNRLVERFESLPEHANFVIAETGFGCGLNFLLTWQLWLKTAPKTATLYYYSCEHFPLTKADLKRCLALWPELQNEAAEFCKNYPILTPDFHPLEFGEGRIKFTLMLGEANSCYQQLLVCGDRQLEPQLRTNFVDAWYLDGFSPKKNQAMWSKDLCQTLALLSKQGTSLATYSAAASVKENLRAAGFLLQKLKGFGAKRQMVVGQFNELLTADRKLRSTPWHINSKAFYKTKKALVLGAGLAGCYTAYALAKRGWQVSLIDEQPDLGLGASGNRQAVLYPKLSAYRSPLTSFMLTSFLFASRFYQQVLETIALGELSGFLQLAFDEQEQQSQVSIANWLSAYPELARLVDKQEASNLAGIELNVGGLFIVNSGWLDSQGLCQFLRQTEGIDWFPNTAISELSYEEGQWVAGAHRAEVLVLANGYQATQFAQTDYLPLKPIRGQMTMIAANPSSQVLKIPLCGDGHILPAQNDLHAFGASYHLGSKEKGAVAADDQTNLERLAKLPTTIAWSEEIKANWAGIRAATSDYLPLVGPVPEVDSFKSRFASLATNAKRWLPFPGTYLPGLFLCAGFGSRGLTTIPLAGEYLASLIANEPLQISQAMAQSLAPARFLVKELAKSKTKCPIL